MVYDIPAPEGDDAAPLRALIFDSYFDAYRGVVALIRVVDGHIKKGDKIRMMATGTETLVEEVGARHPQEVPEEALYVGEVGYLVTGLKDVSQVKVGDTITVADGGVNEPLPGYREAKPMVFTGLFPIDGDQYEPLKEALEKLSLNDPALVWEPETSHALGFGFRVGFLGLLHMEVIKERLEREFGLDASGHGALGGVPRVPQGRRDGVAPLAPGDARPRLHRSRGRALSEGEDPHPARLRGRCDGSGRGSAPATSSP